jgi:hypothetical protein
MKMPRFLTSPITGLMLTLLLLYVFAGALVAQSNSNGSTNSAGSNSSSDGSTSSAGGNSTSQGASQNSDSPAAKQLQALKDKQQLLEQKLTVLTDQQKLIQAMVPAGKSTPHTPGITTDADVKIEAAALSYEALQTVAEELRKQLAAEPNVAAYIIWNQNIDAGILGYETVTNQLAQLASDYDVLTKKPTQQELAAGALLPALPGLATGVLSSIGDILAYFRTSEKIEGRPITIEEAQVVAALVQALRQAGANTTVKYPAVFTANATTIANSSLLALIQTLRGTMQTAAMITAAYDAKTDADKKTDAYASRVALLKATNTATQSMLDDLNKPQNGVTPLMDLLRAERVITDLKDDARLLQLKVTQAGGENKTTSSFWHGVHLSHSGGAIIQYIAFDKAGNITRAGSVGEVNGFRELPADSKSDRIRIGFIPPMPAAKEGANKPAGDQNKRGN